MLSKSSWRRRMSIRRIFPTYDGYKAHFSTHEKALLREQERRRRRTRFLRGKLPDAGGGWGLGNDAIAHWGLAWRSTVRIRAVPST